MSCDLFSLAWKCTGRAWALWYGHGQIIYFFTNPSRRNRIKPFTIYLLVFLKLAGVTKYHIKIYFCCAVKPKSTSDIESSLVLWLNWIADFFYLLLDFNVFLSMDNKSNGRTWTAWTDVHGHGHKKTLFTQGFTTYLLYLVLFTMYSFNTSACKAYTSAYSASC